MLINPPSIKGAGYILRFDKTVLSIGTLAEDDAPRMYRFACTNVSGKTINLTHVRTTCECTVAGVRTGEAFPDETRVVVLTYHPENHPGTMDTSVFVYLSSSSKMPVTRLILIGNMLPRMDEWGRYPCKVGKLRLKQDRVEFRGVNAGRHPSERILYGNSGDRSLCLSAVVVLEFAAFRTELEVISPGSEADVVITIGASLILVEKGRSFTLPIIIEGVEGQPLDRTLNIKINRIK